MTSLIHLNTSSGLTRETIICQRSSDLVNVSTKHGVWEKQPNLWNLWSRRSKVMPGVWNLQNPQLWCKLWEPPKSTSTAHFWKRTKTSTQGLRFLSHHHFLSGCQALAINVGRSKNQQHKLRNWKHQMTKYRIKGKLSIEEFNLSHLRTPMWEPNQ